MCEAPTSQVEQVNIQAGAILLPGVNTSLNFRRSGEHSFDFRSMSEHRQVRVYGESRLKAAQTEQENRRGEVRKKDTPAVTSSRIPYIRL